MLRRGANVTLGNGTLTIFDQTGRAVADGGRACRSSQVLCGLGGSGRGLAVFVYGNNTVGTRGHERSTDLECSSGVTVLRTWAQLACYLCICIL